MPHCIIDCPASLAERVGEQTLLAAVHDAIDASGLFKPGDIKARLNTFSHYRCGAGQDDFVHVALYLFAGRSAEQRRSLASAGVAALVGLLPEVEALSMDVREMTRETFVNRSQYLEQAALTA
ncbi:MULTISPECIES: 5-carboxymethyl-2-hydroxymuconate Delta-isomerase [Pseudomonas]|jgi:5-carboxymethyl-2-hydroxymuconate isomerase|uniref:Muconate delta-isomerase n=1 Tax=Pseudomonas putida TaxID=303 RepID=A0A1L7NFL2_PSEPU|nr:MULTISPECIES: 5-carboxymethyl-2-hydroxymuconate Delta-isomerase [Pseudomonas]PNB59178.1 5-carboxymethyl-2-hydroxymuconate isomerase [Pseudomonas sp. FW305-130]AGN83011.1 muconate delta-isomerase [Pseudomonas putida H8234]EKT4450538.1 5-carboxymethyl-2-hydroxymuconate Delta-isomerase [Pseudomonas putida]EKT4559173.1 5-carboxymethyl-2-hydroxymuconate Delta-isomerase [Pseudomonas putida]MBH3469847.1 5-carboxymethyl-2-hydroxymuconate Delta-isomerase [Pseudomonas putida]